MLENGPNLSKTVTLEDMRRFTGSPFSFDSTIYSIGENYFDPWRMDISLQNQFAVDNQIEYLNEIIRRAYLHSDKIPLDLCLPTSKINYQQSKIICNPYTKTGKPSKYPFSLVVLFDQKTGDEKNIRIDYFPDETTGKAKIVYWENRILYVFKYKTIGREFILGEVKTNKFVNVGELPTLIYKL